MQLSFIIPVYNVEQYVENCIDSIIDQHTSEYEIILVDDGSTDHSGNICDRYAHQYTSIKLFHKENTGVADSRNYGLKHASGKYVTFVDSDDIIEFGSVERIIDWTKRYDADICFLNGVKWFDKYEEPMDKPYDREQIIGKQPDYVLHYLTTMGKYPGSACTKLFKREFLEKFNISFPCERIHGEDLTFVRKALIKANSFDYLPCLYYRYRQGRKGAATDCVNSVSFFELFKFIEESVQECNTVKDVFPGKHDSIMNFVAYEYAILLWHSQFVSKKHKKKSYQFLSEYRWVLKYSNSPRIKIIAILTKCLGIKIVAKILSVYMKVNLK